MFPKCVYVQCTEENPIGKVKTKLMKFILRQVPLLSETAAALQPLV